TNRLTAAVTGICCEVASNLGDMAPNNALKDQTWSKLFGSFRPRLFFGPRALMMRRLLPLALGAAWALSVLGCGPAGQGEGPGHRPQELSLTPAEELALGERAYREILSKSHVVTRGPEVERVDRVGMRIAKAAEIEPLQRESNLRVRGFRFDW